MAELLSTYKRQSVIERNWRCCKNPKLFLDAIYLKSAGRIDALLWMMSLALLVYAAMEYKIKKTLTENKIEFPNVDKNTTTKPTLARVFQYISNCRITVMKDGNGTISLNNLTDVLQQVLMSLGVGWCKYYNFHHYERAFF